MHDASGSVIRRNKADLLDANYRRVPGRDELDRWPAFVYGRACMRAVARPCCCTSCCTDLTITRHGDSLRLLPATLALLGPSAFAGVHRCWRRLLEPPDSSADFQTERWQAGRMGALFVLAGILVGLAVYRSGEARARWQSLRAARTTARNQRDTAWRHTGSAVLYVAGAILLLFIVLKLFK